MKEFNKILTVIQYTPNVFLKRFNKNILKKQIKWKDVSVNMQYLETRMYWMIPYIQGIMKKKICKQVDTEPELKRKEERNSENQHQLWEMLKYKAASNCVFAVGKNRGRW